MVVASGTPLLPLLTTVFTVSIVPRVVPWLFPSCNELTNSHFCGSQSVLEVFILCLAGYILAWKGIIDKRIQKALNRLNVFLFTPALLFSKVALFLSPKTLRELWIIPIFFVILTGISAIVAYILGTIFRLRKSQRNFAMACSMFMNSNSLPLALMQSLVVTVPGLKWDKNDNKDIMLGRALTYLVIFYTLGMIVRWSYGVRLLATKDDPISPLEQDEGSPLLSDTDDASETTANEDAGDCRARYGPRPASHLAPMPATAIYHSYPNSPTCHNAPLPPPTPSPMSSSEVNINGEGDAPFMRGYCGNPSSRLPSFYQRSRSIVAHGWRKFEEFMTVPLWASLASLLVACIQPLQHALNEHMQPIKGSLASAGGCSIPITLIVLGAYFYTPPEDRPESRRPSLTTMNSASSLFSNFQDMFKLKRTTRSSPYRSGSALSSSSQRLRRGETKAVVIAVVSRMIIVPILLLPLMALSTTYALHAVFSDPVFVVSTVLLIGSPPALTLVQITQAGSNDAFERLLSRTVFWSYCIVTPPTACIYVVVGVLLAKR
ncbi:membrane transport protein-domain-containing protein [Hygrophoropsis aurantiaca]|uniref:Membrane transport protein-domain-containing protein n=1 Tax=Hygrophoropsis aurantiaca TaxID=72124 RepID=A0ACB8A7Y2_9AGAM|nr:membrane transport protein-domain-containing protein [Hygrophoropsis aurantiaca]